MTDISHVFAPTVTTRTRSGRGRSPLAVVTDGVRRILRSYSEAIAKESYIVPDGRMAYAAGQLAA